MKNITIPSLPKFNSAAGSNFSRELRANVESYFRKADISKFANGALKFKAIILLVSFFKLAISTTHLLTHKQCNQKFVKN